MQAIEQAKKLHQMGRIAEAEAAYRSVLARDPRQFDALHLLGLIQYQQGRPQEAQDLLSQAVKLKPRSPRALSVWMVALLALNRLEEALAVCDRILAIEPRDADTLYNRAVVLSRLRRFEAALAAFDKVLTRDAGYIDAWFERGNLLAQLSRFDEAAVCYDHLLAKAPGHPGALTNRGNALLKLGRHTDALSCYDKLLAAAPADINALNNRGVALKDLGRYDEAMASCERALTIDPNSVDALTTRGNILTKLGRHEEALASFERAVAIRPRDLDALNNRGLALTHLRRLGEAVASFDQVLAIDPVHVEGLYHRGVVLFGLNRFDDALAAFERTLAVSPDHAEALYHRGYALANLGRSDEATAAWERVLALDPAHRHALGALAQFRLTACDWSDVERLRAQLRRALDEDTAVVQPFTLLAYGVSPKDQLRYTRQFVRHRIATVPQLAGAHKPREGDKIRLAYLSADFRPHPVAYQLAGLIEQHDRARFDVSAISFGSDGGSDIRARLVGAFDRFEDVSFKSDREVAQLLRDLHVDIAVDLMGHTLHARPVVMACRPAPINVSFLGYPGTAGADFIDYLIADKIALPFEQQPNYAEKIVHLPEGFFVHDPKKRMSPQPPTRSQAGLPERGFVFCGFNNSYKLSAPVFEVWMRLLASTEGSVLWLSQANDRATANLRGAAGAYGIDPGRIIFASRVPSVVDHLARYRLADLFLDTLPYNAHSTANDALWAGLPVLTCIGKSFAGRVAASMLYTLGMPELVTSDLDEYEAVARQLVAEPSRLQAVRRSLNERRESSPLFNLDRYRQHIETAYTTMWERCRRGDPPEAFAVPLLGQGDHC